MGYADQSLTNLDLPNSVEAEQTVLGSILVNPEVLNTINEIIKPEMMYKEQHRELYSIILSMDNRGIKSDIITVLNEAVKQKVFDTPAEGKSYLAFLMNSITTVANIADHCKIISEKYYIRSLAIISQQLLNDISIGSYDANRLLDVAEQRIFDIRQGKDIRGLTPLNDIVFESYERLIKITGPEREKFLGAKTGFSSLDTITTGLNRSDLILVAARPAMGKTSFAMNIALNVARHSNKDVAIFSLEMSKEQLATRLLSTEALVDSHKLRSGKISNGDWENLASSADVLCHMPIYIDDTAAITVQQMKSKLRRVKNLGLVVIDYLQLMTSTLKTDNRVTVISEITRQLKIMAKELDVPVMLLSQLSRGPESRTDKRPMLSDLRESGSIEQDADIVLFLYRDAYYNKESTQPNISECIVAKNRHGEVGTIEMVWDGQFTRFANKEG